MPSYLHPRSAATSTLFAGTLLASFIVVGIPHVFPCPRPRKGYADSEVVLDGEGRPVKRIRRPSDPSINLEPNADSILLQKSAGTGNAALDAKLAKTLEEEAVLFQQLQEEAVILDKNRRECPVPKPTGPLGRFLGFEKDGKEQWAPTTQRSMSEGKTLPAKKE